MTSELIIPKDIMPPGKIHQKVLEKGALARLDGQSQSSNPYNIIQKGGFWTSWAKGWLFADMGDIKIKESQ